MADYFSAPFSTTNVYTFDSNTGKLSHAVVPLPPRPGSHSTSSEAPVYTPGPLDADLKATLGEDAPRIVEEIPIRGGQTVYFVAKLHPRATPRQGFWEALDPRIRRAKRRVIAMERLVWQLEAALAEEDGSSESDYEGDVDSEDDSVADANYESDDGGCLDFNSEATTSYPAARVNEDSACAFDLGEGPAGVEASASLSSDSSSDSVTLDPPSLSLSVSPTEELAPSIASAKQPSTPSQIVSPSLSALPSSYHSAIGDPSMIAEGAGLSSPPHLESNSGDGSLLLEATSDAPGSEEQPCPACYTRPIRLLWGDEPSEHSLSDLVDELLAESDPQSDDARTLEAALPQVDVPICSPIIAADWSLTRYLDSLCGEARTAAICEAGSSSSMGSLFSERQDARAGSDSESEDEPLIETAKRRHKTRTAEKDASSRDAPGETAKSDESVEIPLRDLQALRVEKGQPRPPTTGQPSPTASRTTVQQEASSRASKRRRDDEKEEGEISDSDSDESEPDVPLAHVLASRRKSAQRTLGCGPPPAKRLKFTPAVEARRLSRENGRSRRSWAHKRWEERLKQKHARGNHDSRRGIRIISTDEELLRKGMRAEEEAYWRWDARCITLVLQITEREYGTLQGTASYDVFNSRIVQEDPSGIGNSLIILDSTTVVHSSRADDSYLASVPPAVDQRSPMDVACVDPVTPGQHIQGH
ncbi:hypothetical protein LXA43DRAFT_1083933 [Ganoderma leucocontextum]|nr:hypothetical protein LXA43DRAFT_1083933 [Ganoderma leucocontextum]